MTASLSTILLANIHFLFKCRGAGKPGQDEITRKKKKSLVSLNL
jgi:hypothetical protein